MYSRLALSQARVPIGGAPKTWKKQAHYGLPEPMLGKPEVKKLAKPDEASKVDNQERDAVTSQKRKLSSIAEDRKVKNKRKKRSKGGDNEDVIVKKAEM